MKKIIVFGLLLLLVFGLFAEIQIIKADSGVKLDPKTLSKDLKQYDVIFFGERHGDKALHRLQREILPGLLDGERELILSFEMWERDAQKALDSFISGDLSEADFKKISGIWPNYEDYRPLLIFAQKNKLQAVAANIPRSYANRTAKEGWGFVEHLPPEERALIATKLSAPDDAYREAFFTVMGKMSSHPMNQENLQNMYLAQCIKDDTMAESIALALKDKPTARLIHFNGDFHSRNFLGTVSRLKKSMPELKIAVLTPQTAEPSEEILQNEGAALPGTHLLLVPAEAEEQEL